MRSASRVWLIVGPLALAAGGGALAAVLTSGHEENRILVSVFGLLVGWSFVVAGLIARTRRPENRTGILMIAVGFTFFVGALGDATPASGSCTDCPENAFLISDNATADAVLSVIFEGLGFVIIAFTVAILVRRWRRSSPAARRLLG